MAIGPALPQVVFVSILNTNVTSLMTADSMLSLKAWKLVTSENEGYPLLDKREVIDECFIATACFGSKYESHVALLRQFRDRYLLTNFLGQKFVEFYYHNSPPAANFIANSEPLKVLVRILLLPLITVAYLLFHPLAMAAAGLGCFVLILTRRRIKVHLR
ncbi:MAG: CFI-box-CTERM domain-containing protein [Bacillota bacterium]|nr:CFI-box-CTERM domain-containing protein [Bacillota bacterium]